MKKRFLSLLVISSLLFSLAGNVMAADVKDFKDVSKSNWFYDEVDLVTDKGYFNGVAADRFAPYENMTRAMFVTALSRLDKAEVNNGVTKFDDVAKNTYYTGAVTWANENGIVKGNGNGTFEPAGDITREQMCAIMDRYIEYFKENHEDYTPKTVNATPSFADMDDVSAYAKEAVLNCVKYGLIEGYDGKFLPKDNATRAEVAAVISRLEFVVYGGGAGGGGGTGGNGGNGGNTPDTPENPVPENRENDYIADAITAAIGVYNNYVDGMDISKFNTGFDMEPIMYDADPTDGNLDNNLTVSGQASVSDDLVTNIIVQAAESVCLILGPDNTTETEVIAIVTKLVSEFNGSFGTTIDSEAIIKSLYARDKESIKNQLTNEIVAPARGAVDGLWDNFQQPGGKFVTGDVTVSTENAKFVIKPSANGTTVEPAGKGNKAEVAAKMAFDVAKHMYADLTTKYTKGYETVVTMDGTIDIKFSKGDFEDQIDNYDYTLTVEATLDGGELVEYKYADNSFVKLNITDDIQEKYAAAVDAMVKDALDRVDVKTAVGAKIDAAVEAMKGNAVFQNAESLGVKDDADAAVNAWKKANLDVNNLADSNAYKMYWEQDATAKLDNTAIYALVDKMAVAAANNVIADVEGRGTVDFGHLSIDAVKAFKLMMKDAEPSNLEELMGADYDLGIDLDSMPDVKDYVIAVVTDRFNEYAEGKANDWAAEYEDAMQAEVDSFVTEQIEGHEMFAYLDKAIKVKSIEDMKDVHLGNLATALENATFQKFVDGKGDSIVDRVTDMIAKLPANAAVTVNGVEISEATLNKIQNAETTAQACKALADFIGQEGLAGLTLEQFDTANGIEIKAEYDARSFTMNLVICLDDNLNKDDMQCDVADHN